MATSKAPRIFFGFKENAPILVIKGSVRYVDASALRVAIDRLPINTGDHSLIIDLRELDVIDSTGLGLLAHVGRTTLRRGRRAVIVCAVRDIMTCLRSVAFDTLFHILDTWPFDSDEPFSEVPLGNPDPMPETLGRFMLEAHRDLAAVSESNRRSFAEVITALETDLEESTRAHLH